MSDIISDEALMAFVDGELEPAESRRIERALREKPALRSRLRVFERTGQTLASSFELEPRPIPPALVSAPPLPMREQFAKWLDDALSFLPTSRGWALASLAVIFGLSASLVWQVATPRNQQTLISAYGGQLKAGGVLRAALESSPSGGFDAARTETAIIQTFVNTGGRYCREYVAEAAGRGVACRTDDGEWQVMLHSASVADNGASGKFSPAGTGDDQFIDGYVHQVMQGEALTGETERVAISNKWRP